MRASVHGRVPAPVIAALERLGLELGEGGDVAFVWYDPSAGGVDLEDLGALARFGEPVVAFVSRPEYKETALAAGATPIFSPSARSRAPPSSGPSSPRSRGRPRPGAAPSATSSSGRGALSRSTRGIGACSRGSSI